MLRNRFATAAAAALLSCLLASHAAASLIIQDPGGNGGGDGDVGPTFNGFPGTLTFTSGNPPIGDGESYPRNINPARQAPGGGASPGSFFTTLGVDFNNLNGNPAYFDSNNLLTRPATLINNEAFWTDPKIGSFRGDFGLFELAQIGFSFLPGFTTGADFGFDLAVASVSEDLPTGSFYDDQSGLFITAPFLPFQIQDDNFNIARGELVFAEGLASDPSNGLVVFAEAVGTFPTLGSPRTAYEARFRVDEAFLRAGIEYENGSGGGDPEGGDIVSGPIEFFDIDLESIATFGGTTQVALDNFVLGGSGVIGDTLREPLTYRPFDPVGENTPQYFLIEGDPFDGITDGITEALDIAESAADGEFDAPILATPTPNGSQSTHVTVTLPINSPLRSGPTPPGGLVVEYDSQIGDDPTAPGESPFGGVVEVTPVDASGEDLGGWFLVESTGETSGLFGGIAGSLSSSLGNISDVLLANLGVDVSQFGLNDALPLNNLQLAGLFDGLAETFDFASEVEAASSGGLFGSIFTQLNLAALGVDGPGTGAIASLLQDTFAAGGTGPTLGGLFDTYSQAGGLITQALGPILEMLVEQDQQVIPQSVFDALQNAMRDPGAFDGVVRMVSPDAQSEGTTSPFALLTDEPDVYVNYTLDEYLALMAAEGNDPRLGDSGGYFEPVFNAAGQVIDIRVHSWLVADQGGRFITGVTFLSGASIPEPATAALLVGLVALPRRRVRR